MSSRAPTHAPPHFQLAGLPQPLRPSTLARARTWAHVLFRPCLRLAAAPKAQDVSALLEGTTVFPDSVEPEAGPKHGSQQVMPGPAGVRTGLRSLGSSSGAQEGSLCRQSPRRQGPCWL